MRPHPLTRIGTGSRFGQVIDAAGDRVSYTRAQLSIDASIELVLWLVEVRGGGAGGGSFFSSPPSPSAPPQPFLRLRRLVCLSSCTASRRMPCLSCRARQGGDRERPRRRRDPREQPAQGVRGRQGRCKGYLVRHRRRRDLRCGGCWGWSEGVAAVPGACGPSRLPSSRPLLQATSASTAPARRQRSRCSRATSSRRAARPSSRATTSSRSSPSCAASSATARSGTRCWSC